MFGFFLKKSFCDIWDNLLGVFIFNILFVFLGLGFFYLAYAITQAGITWLFYLVILLGIMLFCVLALAWGENGANVADFGSIHYRAFFKAIPGCIVDGVLLGLFICIVFYVSEVCLQYYFIEQKSLLGFFLGSVVFWLDVMIILSLQWFIPLRSLMHNNFRKTLKKCFIIFYDNTGFSIAMFIYNILMIALSIFCIGMMPSVTGIIIANCNALRLRLYKYDYLEEHPELKTKRERSQIPWEELIYEDKETLGPRKFKSFLFPWKDDKQQNL